MSCIYWASSADDDTAAAGVKGEEIQSGLWMVVVGFIQSLLNITNILDWLIFCKPTYTISMYYLDSVVVISGDTNKI